MRLVSMVRFCGSVMVLGGLMAACAEGTGSGQQTAPASTAAKPQTPPAADGSRINMAQCQTPANDTVSFRLADTVLRVPSKAVEDTVPEGLQQPIKKEAVRQAVQAQVSAGAGCPEKPLDAVLLVLRDEPAHPLLQGGMGLLKTAPGGITTQFAKLTGQLRDKPAKNCRSLKGDLLACVGTETRSGRETQVMYVISLDRKVRMNSGGPLAARCLLEGEKIQGCNIVDQLTDRVALDVTLNPGEYTSNGLRDARQAALNRLKQWRL